LAVGRACCSTNADVSISRFWRTSLMPRDSSVKNQHMRAHIAAAAARLMAQDGIDDYALAKRKAARQLGSDSTQALPTNEEVESELRIYQSIYQADEQEDRVRALREHALQVMQALEPYRPYLYGGVLNGTAGRYSAIELQLFTDDSKGLELYLLNRQIPYDTEDRRAGSAEHLHPITLLMLEWDGVPVSLAVHPGNDERVAPKAYAHGEAGRANLSAVRQLLEEAT